MANIFDTINKKFERQSKLKGIVISIAIHVIVLFISIPILGLKAPVPPLDGGGVEVNFGTSDMGSGAVQPMTDNAQNAANPPPAAAAAPEESAQKDDNILTQTTEDAPEMTQSKAVKKTIVKKHTPIKKIIPAPVAATTPVISAPKVKPAPPAPPAPTVDQRAMYKGAKGPTNNSTGEGPDKMPGDKGMPTGDANGKAYTGTPGDGGKGKGGSGPKSNLAGRTVIQRPIIHDDSQKFGVVVVNIKVDGAGKVIEATYSLNGSTTNDAELIKKAIKAAYGYGYSAANIPEEEGTITVDFQGQ